jgi:hypothetical protein
MDEAPECTRAFSAGVSALHDPWGAAPGQDEHCAFGAKHTQSEMLIKERSLCSPRDAKHIPFNQGEGQKMYADPQLVPVDPFPLRQLT